MRVVSVFVGLALLVAPRTARALEEPITAKLEWREGPAGANCIDQATLQAAVEQRLARKIFVASEPSDVVVRAAVERRAQRWAVAIELAAAHGEPMGHRELESEGTDCSTLDDALALVLAVMLDISKTRVPPPPAEQRPPPAPEPAPTRAPVVRAKELSSTLRLPEDTPARRPALHFDFGGGISGALGLTPEAVLGLHAYVALDPPEFWRLALDFSTYQSSDKGVEGTNAGAAFRPFAVGVAICPLSKTPPGLGFELCLLQHFGRLSVQGYGFDENQAVARTYVAVGLRGGVRVELLGPLFARLALDLETPLVRETFRYGGASGAEPSLFRMSAVLAAGQLGLGAQF